MKIERRKVTNAIDNFRGNKQISYEIRDDAAAHSKAISKLLNADVRIAYLLVETITAMLVPDRKVRVNVEARD